MACWSIRSGSSSRSLCKTPKDHADESRSLSCNDKNMLLRIIYDHGGKEPLKKIHSRLQHVWNILRETSICNDDASSSALKVTIQNSHQTPWPCRRMLKTQSMAGKNIWNMIHWNHNSETWWSSFSVISLFLSFDVFSNPPVWCAMRQLSFVSFHFKARKPIPR